MFTAINENKFALLMKKDKVTVPVRCRVAGTLYDVTDQTFQKRVYFTQLFLYHSPKCPPSSESLDVPWPTWSFVIIIIIFKYGHRTLYLGKTPSKSNRYSASLQISSQKLNEKHSLKKHCSQTQINSTRRFTEVIN